jgi:hypothetical protein
MVHFPLGNENTVNTGGVSAHRSGKRGLTQTKEFRVFSVEPPGQNTAKGSKL